MLSRVIGEPKLVRPVCGELVPDPPVLISDGAEVVVDRGARLLAVASALLSEHAPPAVGRCDAPRRPICHRFTGVAGLIGEEPVPELGVVPVRVEQRVRAIRFHHLATGDRVRQPPVVRLTSKLQYPTRHRHGDPRCGELSHERVKSFPGRFACDRYAAARGNMSFSCFSSRILLLASRNFTAPLRVAPGFSPSWTPSEG